MVLLLPGRETVNLSIMQAQRPRPAQCVLCRTSIIGLSRCRSTGISHYDSSCPMRLPALSPDDPCCPLQTTQLLSHSASLPIVSLPAPAQFHWSWVYQCAY
ncbi:hypothetical protein MHYP_G00021810 [Metynnis hypsauchen]